MFPPFLRRVRRRLPGLILGIALGLAGAGTLSAADGTPLRKVRLQLKWQHQFQFAGYYAAIEQGYYRAAGLDVELIEAQPERDPVQAVLEGRAEFGVGNSDLLLLRAAGQPVVVLAAIFQHSPLLLVARAASGVTDLQGLQNREMMMIDSEKAELLAYFKHEGVDVSRLHLRPHTLRLGDFVEGKVDAMSAYSTDEPFALRQAGVGFLAFTPRSGGIDFYGDNLYTTEVEIRRDPAAVRAFRAASLRGWDYALAHPAETIALIEQRYQSHLSHEHLVFEAAQTAELMHPGIIEVGHLNPGRWRHIADTYAEFGMLPAGFDLGGFLYDPDPRPDLRWVYWTLGVLGAVTLATVGWIVPLVRLNRRLREATLAAEAANTAKSRYLAFLSHEIRTPLNGIVSMIGLLRTEKLPPAPAEYVALANEAADNLLQLVDNVLEHSRMEADSVTIAKQPVALAGFVQALAALQQPAAAAKQLRLGVSLAPDLPAGIVTDPLRLRQVLTNLLANAIKFTERGRVDLEVAVAPAGPGDRLRQILFHVRDTGCGIPPERLGRIFQPFAQADESVARHYGGSGLGLAISQRIAALLDGVITVQSTPGRGSTFTLALTAEVTVTAPPAGPASRSAPR